MPVKVARTLYVVLVILALAALLPVAVYMLNLHSPPVSHPPSTTALEPHGQIVVTDTSQFTAPGTGVGCQCIREGYGNSSHPFVISDWEVNASEGDATTITRTDANFVILNVKVNVGIGCQVLT